MDLGISGRRAIICASSRGLGFACALSIAREGGVIFINGRNQDTLDAANDRIRQETGATVTSITADITTEEGRSRLVGACPEPDILVTNNAGPAPGKLQDWDHDAWINALEANMLAPALLIRSVVPGMVTRNFGRIVNITSAMVKSPRPHMGLSTAARAGLTALSKAVSIEVAQSNVTINNLLPERIDTGRQTFMVERKAAQDGISVAEARRLITETVAAKRFGRPEEFGDACAFLCSQQASFISGQNLQIDGGSYPGLI